MTGLVLGFTKDIKWLILPIVVLGLLFQHAVQGWCPLVPLFRRLGFRTRKEIDVEKFALKSLKGDFSKIQISNDKTTRSQTEEIYNAVVS